MRSYPVVSLANNTFFNQELYLDKQFLLLNQACPFTDSLKSALVEWGFKEVFSEGAIGGAETASDSFEQVTIDDVVQQEEKASFGQGVKKVLQEAAENTTQGDIDQSEKSRMNVVQNVYNEYMNYITAIYTHYATHKKLNYEELTETVKELCIFIKDNRSYVLRITPKLEAKSKDFIVSHSMRSTVTAIVIGLQLRLQLGKLIELGITCILHEIGQIRLPPQLYMTDRKLSNGERATLATHSLLGSNIVKANDFPTAIQLGILEHHEREDGSGYPLNKKGDQISLYAKIIAVACSFEAITAPRHFREARTPYEGMIELLKGNGKQFDDTVIKALLYSVSLYPIGAYVYLTNGKIAQVVDVNPTDPKNPIVQLVVPSDSKETPKPFQTNTDISIARMLNKQESTDLENQMNKAAETN